ncbi:MAG: glycosyltransferase family 4 protein [Clostridia bacterium]|nr:glycosyltransferase family 4 protein [Clostridia bacterium]
MKILFIGAGTSNHTLRWVNSLVERGHDVLLLTRKDQPINNQYSNKVKVVLLHHCGGLGYYFNVRQVRKIFKQFKPDIVNAHYLTGYGTTARLAKLKPLVLSAWGSDVFDFPNKSRINKWLLKKNVFYADAIASTSFTMANELKKLFPNYKKSITVTPFGIDIEKFTPYPKIDNNSIIIGIVKYLKPIYNIDLLIDAFTIIHKKFNNTKLEIYGDGPLKNELIEQCKRNGILDCVNFHGLIPNDSVPKVINCMDIFVNCSLQESFGVAVLEAMACEKPVVVTTTPGYCEIVEDGIDGIILKDRNPQTMATAFEKLIVNPDLRLEYGKNGRKKVCEKYVWNDNVLTMIDLYKRISKKG